MTLRDRLSAICQGLPEGASVSLPVDWIREVLEADEGAKENGDRLLTLEEVAEELDRAVSTVRTWCNSGALDGAFKLNGREWRVPRGALRRYLEDQASPGRRGHQTPPPGPVNLSSWRRVRSQRQKSPQTGGQNP